MTITIQIQDPGELSFDEIQDFLMESIANNGIHTEDDNVEITNDETTGDPNELEDKPLPGGPGNGTNAGPGGPTSATLPMSGAGPTQGVQ